MGRTIRHSLLNRLYWARADTQQIISKVYSPSMQSCRRIEVDDWNDKGYLGKAIYYAIELPFGLLRWASTLPPEAEGWNRVRAACFPVFGSMFVCFAFDCTDQHIDDKSA